MCTVNLYTFHSGEKAHFNKVVSFWKTLPLLGARVLGGCSQLDIPPHLLLVSKLSKVLYANKLLIGQKIKRGMKIERAKRVQFQTMFNFQ